MDFENLAGKPMTEKPVVTRLTASICDRASQPAKLSNCKLPEQSIVPDNG